MWVIWPTFYQIQDRFARFLSELQLVVWISGVPFGPLWPKGMAGRERGSSRGGVSALMLLYALHALYPCGRCPRASDLDPKQWTRNCLLPLLAYASCQFLPSSSFQVLQLRKIRMPLSVWMPTDLGEIDKNKSHDIAKLSLWFLGNGTELGVNSAILTQNHISLFDLRSGWSWSQVLWVFLGWVSVFY